MKRIAIMLAVAAAVIMVIAYKTEIPDKKTAAPSDNPAVASQSSDSEINSNQNPNNNLFLPMDKASERVTKKPFGIYITYQDSPIQPERFSGYHTGTDFEVFPEDQDMDVSVYAIISGKISAKKWVSGYGGVLIESANINGSAATIIYGHLKLDSIDKKPGDALDAGEQIGILGKGYSQETDGERKHLHLGIHKGEEINIKGYVNNKSELDDWIDFMDIISKS